MFLCIELLPLTMMFVPSTGRNIAARKMSVDSVALKDYAKIANHKCCRRGGTRGAALLAVT